MMRVDLSSYDNSWYQPGSFPKRMLWFIVSTFLFETALLPFSGIKVRILRIFGAKIGRRVFIKPRVHIKYPWFLDCGNDIWLGEYTWIDNLAEVKIGDNVCISQGAMLLTGNHDFTKKTFDLMTKSITLNDGAWVGAKSVVCPGVEMGPHSILTVGSVATRNLDENGIYKGNPAQKVGKRTIR